MPVGDVLRRFAQLWQDKIGPGIEQGVSGVEGALMPTRKPTGWDVAIGQQEMPEARGIGNLARYGIARSRANVAQEGLEQNREKLAR